MGYGRVLALLLSIVVVASLLVALYFTYYMSIEKRGRYFIGLIRVEGAVLYDEDAYRYLSLVEYAAMNSSIKAVVVYVNSPGGYADLVEAIYLGLSSLGRVKPLVCVAQLALSGGYYIAVAAEHIYVYPTSYVGSIGVIGVGPPILVPSERVMETGPYKVVGFSRLLFPYNLTEALNNFLDAVESGRRGKLRLNREELSRGLIYTGSEAVKLGLADELGSLRDALNLASEKAGIKEYEILDLNTGRPYTEYTSPRDVYESVWGSISLEALSSIHPPPALYYIYLPPHLYMELHSQYHTARSDSINSTGRVLVDLSHGNTVSWLDLDVLSGKLVEKGVPLAFTKSWRDIEDNLHNSSALIVATPTSAYTDREARIIEDYVEKGGILILFFDPSVEYVSIPSLAYPINTLASRFNIYFAAGYLYNQVENFGFYRNIYAYIAEEAVGNPIVSNVSRIALFTATHIYSPNPALAYTSSNTYSSTAEKPGRYIVAVYGRRGSGLVIAFSDLTFLQEPYCYIADNLKLIENIASIIARNTPPAERMKKPPSETPKIREISEPRIPVGLEKEYLCVEDGEEYRIIWVKISDREILVVYPETAIHYYYDDEGSLTQWSTDNITCIYLEPIPKPPYPLTISEEWGWRSRYSLSIHGLEYPGSIEGYFRVEDIEEIEVAGRRYIAARIRFEINDTLYMEGVSSRRVSRGLQWICSEIGHIREEATIYYYIDRILQTMVRRMIVLEKVEYRSKSIYSRGAIYV